MTECCKFCGGEDLRPDLIEIGALPGGRLCIFIATKRIPDESFWSLTVMSKRLLTCLFQNTKL